MFSMMLLLLNVKLESWVLYWATKNQNYYQWSFAQVLHPCSNANAWCTCGWTTRAILWVLLLGMWSHFVHLWQDSPFAGHGGEAEIPLHSWQPLILLCNAIPKLMYLLRTSPCFLSPSLQIYDNELRNMLCSITNTLLHSWRPWDRSAVHIAPSAFLASFAGWENSPLPYYHLISRSHHTLPLGFCHHWLVHRP